MVDANSMFGSTFLKTSDVQQPVTYTIKTVRADSIKGVTKLFIEFNETEKTFVVNKTNAKRIMEKLGSSDTDKWSGKQITLQKEWTTYNSQEVACIRVKKE